MIKKIGKKILERYKKNQNFISRILKLKNFKAENAVLIYSEPRSGSTWLMEMVNTIDNSIINWEPAHQTDGVISEKFNFGSRVNIPENNENNEYKKLFKNIFELKLNNTWTNKHIYLTTAMKAKFVVTKFVRCNNALLWAVKNFNFKYKPIYLVRHPLASAVSQIDTFDLKVENTSYEIPNWANNEVYKKYASVLEKIKTPVEKQVATWCIYNAELLEKRNLGKYCTVFYETLTLNPEEEMKRVKKETGLPLPLKRINYKKVSKSNFKGAFKEDQMEQLSKWQNKISEEELLGIQNILDGFGIKAYSTKSVLPIN